MKEIMTAMPTPLLCSGMFTIKKFPDYRAVDRGATSDEVEVETVIVPEIFLEEFVRDLGVINGLEEGLEEEEFETLRAFSRYFDYSESYGYPMCYKVINAIHVDESGRVRVLVHDNFENQIPVRGLFARE